jgi:hypothetical protein
VTFENGRKRQDVWSKRTWEAPEQGAGAGDPVVLTKEQAKNLQANHSLTVFTKSKSNGIIITEGAEHKRNPELEKRFVNAFNKNALFLLNHLLSFIVEFRLKMEK